MQKSKIRSCDLGAGGGGLRDEVLLQFSRVNSDLAQVWPVMLKASCAEVKK